MNKPISLIIPIFNEEEILVRHMAYLLPELRKSYGPIEVILSENGSTDSTKKLAAAMAEEYEEIQSIIDDDTPCYGRALLLGMRAATHEEPRQTALSPRRVARARQLRPGAGPVHGGGRDAAAGQLLRDQRDAGPAGESLR